MEKAKAIADGERSMVITMSEYRHEYKYVCSDRQLICIKNRIEPYMSIDRHAGNNGKYTIRSLYFDSYNNGCYYDNLSGVDPREKFRIRIYDADTSFIRLELKQKQHGMTRKLSCPVGVGLCERLMRGETAGLH